MTNRSRRRFVFSLPAVALAGCSGDDVTPVATRYRTAVDRVLKQYRLPGALAAVTFPGDPDWAVALGEGDLAARTPMRLADHGSIRSVTKSFTVTVILQLVRERVLALADPIERWMPGIPNGGQITLADLAGMQSGIAEYSANPAFLQAFGSDPQRAWTEAELVAFALPGSPRFAPGADYQYSNTNTVLLGMVAAQVAGIPLEEALRARIFAPLRLAQTTYPLVVELPEPHPTPYEVDPDTGAAEALPLFSPTALAGAGAIVSTLADLSTWALALGDGRLIGADLQRERIERSRPATSGPQYDRYGLGIGIRNGWWGHHGSGLGWQGAAFYDPRTGATIAALVNATPNGGHGELNFAQQLFEALAAVVATR